jgi:hypothetical protein
MQKKLPVRKHYVINHRCVNRDPVVARKLIEKLLRLFLTEIRDLAVVCDVEQRETVRDQVSNTKGSTGKDAVDGIECKVLSVLAKGLKKLFPDILADQSQATEFVQEENEIVILVCICSKGGKKIATKLHLLELNIGKAIFESFAKRRPEFGGTSILDKGLQGHTCRGR